MKAEQMKEEMVDEIENMTDNDRLQAEYNHFFGKQETIDDIERATAEASDETDS